MKRRGILIGLLTIVIGVAATSESYAQKPPTPLPVTVTTRDSSIISSDLYLPTDTAAVKFPLVVLLHMLNRDRSTYDDLIPLLTERNLAVLNLDLRGHGQSDFVRRKNIQPKQLSLADFRMMPGDLTQLLKVVEKKTTRVDLTQLGIVGASIGSSVGVLYAANHPKVKALVLLSPGLEYRKINVEPLLVEYGRRPLLIVVGRYDTYPYTSSRTLDSVAVGEKKLQIYNKKQHGTDLIDASRGADSLIVNWLDGHL